MKSVVLKIPYPKTASGRKQWNSRFGLNAYYSGKHWAQRQEDARYWHMLVLSVIRQQGLTAVPFEGPVELRFRWNDRLDLSNHAAMAKMIEDALKGVLFKDDARKYVRGIYNGWHDEDYIEVTVKEAG